MKKKKVHNLKFSKQKVSMVGIKGGRPPSMHQATIIHSECVCDVSGNDCHI